MTQDHHYVPSAVHMGDCVICGNTREAHGCVRLPQMVAQRREQLRGVWHTEDGEPLLGEQPTDPLRGK